jgi:CRP-like cAMP-binding protein
MRAVSRQGVERGTDVDSQGAWCAVTCAWARRAGAGRRHRAGAQVFRHGDAAGHVVFIEYGSVLLQRVERNGIAVAIARREAGALVGLASVIAGAHHATTAVMGTDGAVVEIPRAQVVEGLGHRLVGPRLVAHLAGETLMLVDRCATLAALPVRDRIVDALRDASRSGTRLAVPLSLTTADLTRLVGADASHVCRVLRTLRREGFVDFSRGRIAVRPALFSAPH